MPTNNHKVAHPVRHYPQGQSQHFLKRSTQAHQICGIWAYLDPNTIPLLLPCTISFRPPRYRLKCEGKAVKYITPGQFFELLALKGSVVSIENLPLLSSSFRIKRMYLDILDTAEVGLKLCRKRQQEKILEIFSFKNIFFLLFSNIFESKVGPINQNYAESKR